MKHITIILGSGGLLSGTVIKDPNLAIYRGDVTNQVRNYVYVHVTL